ncbi:MAG TPA: MSHA biogenesis protein MshK [Burkholderiales bacterium]|jgi:MSHA biogenesis protein MshK|nr:MSHA biogenesis protein MshK [Burkholderiales bacterium]
MAPHLNRVLFTIALLAALPVCAQGLIDPTRPPREILGETGEVPDAVAGGSPAQVVVISSDRRQATINGRTVNLGGRYGDATLVRISDEEIVLQKPDSTEIIRLYSSVNRKMRLSPDRAANTAERRED